MTLKYHSLLLATLSALILSACQSLPSAQPPSTTSWQSANQAPSFSAEGRIGAQHQGKGYSFHFEWQVSGSLNLLSTSLPLGIQVATLCRQGNEEIALAQGKIYHAQELAQLKQSLPAYDLLSQYAAFWANGLIAPNVPYQIDNTGTLHQAGWQIERSSKEDGSPAILTLNQPNQRVRLVFDEFSANAKLPHSCQEALNLKDAS